MLLVGVPRVSSGAKTHAVRILPKAAVLTTDIFDYYSWCNSQGARSFFVSDD